MFDYRLRTTTFIYQEYDEENGSVRTVHSNLLPPPDRIVPRSLQIRTPYCDINNTPVYTGDIIGHYSGYTISDFGIVRQDTNFDTGYCTSSTVKGYVAFPRNDDCLVLGDVTEDPADIAFALFKVFSISTFYESEDGETGILDFLEAFQISKDSPPLTAIQKERALAKIIHYRTRLSRIV